MQSSSYVFKSESEKRRGKWISIGDDSPIKSNCDLQCVISLPKPLYNMVNEVAGNPFVYISFLFKFSVQLTLLLVLYKQDLVTALLHRICQLGPYWWPGRLRMPLPPVCFLWTFHSKFVLYKSFNIFSYYGYRKCWNWGNGKLRYKNFQHYKFSLHE